MFSIKNFKNHDFLITICIFLLSIISLLVIYSTTYKAQTAVTGAGSFQKQIVILIGGFLIYLILSSISISWIKSTRPLILVYIIIILLLLYLIFFGTTIANTNRWIEVFGINIQPAEYAKIALILVTSYIFAQRENYFGKFIEWSEPKETNNMIKKIFFKYFLRNETFSKTIFSLIVTMPIYLLVFLQPAFGNSLIIFSIYLAVIFAANSYQLQIINFLIPAFIFPLVQWDIINIDLNLGPSFLQIPVVVIVSTVVISFLTSIKTKLKWYFVIFSIIIGLLVQPAIMTFWDSNIMSEYQKTRINTFFASPESDPLDAGYQVRQSQIAIGSGQLWGRGFLQGTQSTLQVLPFAHTDFAFASVAEQFGLFGSLLLIGIYLMILIRILKTATQTSDEFNFLVATGIGFMLLISIFINIGMNMGKLPVTGIPLPLVSYGGSSVFVNMIALGLIQSIRHELSLRDISESYTPNSHPWV